jgi:FtsP/CotA-like multicopper oxidase with cupredoxin domain
MSKNEVTIDGVVYTTKVSPGDRVLVRCRNAGVHVGTQVSRGDGVLKLANANRIWQWRGGFTLSEVAANGVDRENNDTRIACEVPKITLTESDVCEVIPVSEGVDLTEVHSG